MSEAIGLPIQAIPMLTIEYCKQKMLLVSEKKWPTTIYQPEYSIFLLFPAVNILSPSSASLPSPNTFSIQLLCWLAHSHSPSLPPAALPPKTHRHHSIIPSPRRQFRKSTCRLLLRAAQHLACQPATAAKLLLRGKYRNCSNKGQWQFKLNSGNEQQVNQQQATRRVHIAAQSGPNACEPQAAAVPGAAATSTEIVEIDQPTSLGPSGETAIATSSRIAANELCEAPLFGLIRCREPARGYAEVGGT